MINRPPPKARSPNRKTLLVTIIALALCLSAFLAAVPKAAAATPTSWTYNQMSGHALHNSPLIYSNNIYIAADDGYVCAIDATSNQVLWGPISTGDEFCGSPVAYNGILYVAGVSGTLYAFNLSSAGSGNQLLWSYRLPDRFEGTPTVAGGIVYVAGIDGGVYAFTAGQTCPNNLLWSYQTGASTAFVSSPVVSDGEVYVSSLNGWVYAFDAVIANQTAPLWSLHFADWFYASALVSSGTVFLAGEGGVVYAFPESDQPLSLSSVENYTISRSVAIYGTPVIDSRVIYFLGSDGFLRAFNASDIAVGPLWSFRMLQGPDIGTPAPLLDNGVIYALDGNNTLRAVSASLACPSGLLWSYYIPDTLFASPAVYCGQIFVPAESGKVYAVSLGVPVNFVEEGLHTGTVWSAVLNGENETSTSDSMTFYVAPFETYSYVIDIPYGYIPHTAVSGTISPQDLCPGAYYVEAEFGLTLNHIVVSPNNATMAAGDSTAFSAEGYSAFGDDMGPVSPYFTVSSGAGGSVNGNIVTATVAGTWNVTAYYYGLSSSVSLTVSAGSLAHIAVTSSNSTIVAGKSADFSANGFDAYGNALGQVDAVFNIDSGAGGSVNGNMISATKTGCWNVTASFQGVNGNVPLKVVAGSLDHITISTSNSTVIAGNSAVFSAEGFDSFGNDLGSVPAIFSVNGSPVTSATVKETQAGIYTVTASCNGTTASATLTVTAAGLNHISVGSSSGGIVAGGSEALSAEGYDAYGNDLGAVNASYSLPSDIGGSIIGNLISATKAGSWEITASFPGIGDVSLTLTVSAGSLDHIAVNLPSGSMVAGSTQTFAAEGFDAYGNDLGSVAAALSVNGSPITSGSLSETRAGSYAISASFNGMGASADLTVTAGSLDHITLTSPSSGIVAGGSETYLAQGFDAYGNSLGSIDASLSVNGSPLAGTSVNETKAGSYTVTASYDGATASAALTVSPGRLNHISISSLTGKIVAGNSEAFSAEGFDAFGNDLGPVAASYSIADGADGAVNGNMVSATKAGSWAVTASCPGVSSASTLLSVDPGALDHIALSSSAGSSGIVAGESATYHAEGYDAYGNDLGQVAASLSVAPDAGGSVSGDSVSATKAGSWGVTASLGKMSATASLNVNPGAAASLTVTTDTSKSTDGRSTVTVTAKDAYGNIATDYNGTVKLSSDDSSSNLPANLTLSNGVGTFNENTGPNIPSITATDMTNSSIVGFQAAMHISPPESNPPNPVTSNSSLANICAVSLLLIAFSLLAIKYRSRFKISLKFASGTSLYKLLAKYYVPPQPVVAVVVETPIIAQSAQPEESATDAKEPSAIEPSVEALAELSKPSAEPTELPIEPEPAIEPPKPAIESSAAPVESSAESSAPPKKQSKKSRKRSFGRIRLPSPIKKPFWGSLYLRDVKWHRAPLGVFSGD